MTWVQFLISLRGLLIVTIDSVVDNLHPQGEIFKINNELHIY